MTGFGNGGWANLDANQPEKKTDGKWTLADVTVDVAASTANPSFNGTLQTKKNIVIDARANDRFHGQNETLDPVGGHIPDAINYCFRENLSRKTFKSPEQLYKDFVALLGSSTASEVIHQCGSGVTACHNLLAMEIAGLKGSRVYAGSWSEWCADPSRPVAL
jgi:thiosulfate/3-mercaptopyruvate sulfurtransferase